MNNAHASPFSNIIYVTCVCRFLVVLCGLFVNRIFLCNYFSSFVVFCINFLYYTKGLKLKRKTNPFKYLNRYGKVLRTITSLRVV